MTLFANAEVRHASTGAASSGTIILLYHRVIELDSDPQCLAVSPAHFRQHLEIIRREFRPVSLSDLVESHSTGRMPPRGVVVTFDDGYADNLEIAAPLLEEFDVPATVFVTPRFENAGEFWWDELERVALRPSRIPSKLNLFIAGASHDWTITDGSDRTPSDLEWNALRNDAPTQRQALYLMLCRMLRDAPHMEREAALSELRRWAGVDASARPTHRPLSEDQLVELARREIIEIGAHTLTHPVLGGLPPRLQIEEIVGGRRAIEDAIGRPVTSFAYPFGCRGDFDSDSVIAARHAGMRAACANTGRAPDARARVTSAADRFTLPRAIIRDCDGEEFAHRLHQAFSGSGSRRDAHAYIGA